MVLRQMRIEAALTADNLGVMLVPLLDLVEPLNSLLLQHDQVMDVVELLHLSVDLPFEHIDLLLLDGSLLLKIVQLALELVLSVLELLNLLTHLLDV